MTKLKGMAVKARLISFVLSGLLVAGCAGRQAHPVALDQQGDNQRSCASIELEMSQIQTAVQRLIPESDKLGKNVALGIAGSFVFFPWLFMDLTESERVEINAYQQRYNKLMILATQKKCSFLQVTPDMDDPGSAAAAKATATEKSHQP